MSRKMLAVAAFALAAPLMVARGQVSFGIAAGASQPNGSFGNSVDMGYHVMATVAIMPPLAPIGFRVDGMFNEFNYTNSNPTTKARISVLDANAVFGVPGMVVVSPYLIGGLGMYNSSISPKPALVTSSSSTDMGFNLGGGVKFGLAGFSAFGEVRYHQITNGGARFVPITFGIMF